MQLIPSVVSRGPALFTAAQAKPHMNVEHADHDDLVLRYVRAAQDHVERTCECFLTPAVVDVRTGPGVCRDALDLPRGPVREIVSVSGATGALASDAYALDAWGFRLTATVTGPLTVRYKAGYDDDTRPETLGQAVLLLAAHWYRNREATAERSPAEVPMGVAALLSHHQTWRV